MPAQLTRTRKRNPQRPREQAVLHRISTNERNLTGKVEIAEGLTASSASKRAREHLLTRRAEGQLCLYPLSLTTTDPIKESETFTMIVWLCHAAEHKGEPALSRRSIQKNSACDKQHPMVVDMNGHSLRIEETAQNQVANAIHIGNNKHVKLQTAVPTLPADHQGVEYRHAGCERNLRRCKRPPRDRRACRHRRCTRQGR